MSAVRMMFVAGAVAVLGGLGGSGLGVRLTHSRPTPEDTIIVPIGGSPGGIPHVAWAAPHAGRVLYLLATGHSPGTGAGNITVAVTREGGAVLCSVDVPCDFADGAVIPVSGVETCPDLATFDEGDRLFFSPTTDCATQPDLFLQVAVYVR